jgi:hypothetical protein
MMPSIVLSGITRFQTLPRSTWEWRARGESKGVALLNKV